MFINKKIRIVNFVKSNIGLLDICNSWHLEKKFIKSLRKKKTVTISQENSLILYEQSETLCLIHNNTLASYVGSRIFAHFNVS